MVQIKNNNDNDICFEIEKKRTTSDDVKIQ